MVVSSIKHCFARLSMLLLLSLNMLLITITVSKLKKVLPYADEMPWFGIVRTLPHILWELLLCDLPFFCPHTRCQTPLFRGWEYCANPWHFTARVSAAYSHSSACYLCISYRALPRPPQISVVPTLSVIPHFRRGEKTLIVWHYMMLGHIELHCIMPQGLTGCMNESKHVCVLLSSRLAALYSLQGTKYLRRK